MHGSTDDMENQAGFSLLTFFFLLVLILNAIIIADLFLSILHSPLTLVFFRVVIMLTMLAFLVANSARHPEIKGRGWYFILTGFSLILLESLTDLFSRFPNTSVIFINIDPSTLRFFQDIICRLFGFFCLVYGFFLWIPSIIEARRRVEQTAALLEQKVAERTRSLAESNEQLRRSKIKLEDAARLKNEFLASFSHELKTPLNSILGFCRLLREKRHGPLTPKQLKSIDIIDSNSKSLLERINRILDFAKLEFEKVSPKFKPVKVAELLKESASVFEPFLKGTDVNVVVETDRELVEVSTDAKVIGQLLIATLDNAAKFTKKGTVKLSAGLDRGGQNWWIAVSDTGQGIPSEDLPYIFDAFRQGDGSLSRSHGGTGLGLTIAQRLCRLLDGKIEVKSTVGSGSIFTFSFPLNPQASPSQLAESLNDSPSGNEK